MRHNLPRNASFQYMGFGNKYRNGLLLLTLLISVHFAEAQVACTQPSFAPAVTYRSGGNFLIATAAADFNKDGVLDLAVANNFSPTLGVLLGKGGGAFAPVVTYTTGSNESCLWITTGDFNQDGNIDLVVAIGGSQGVGILLGKGDGRFEKINTHPTNNIYYSIATGDFNKDGNLDLALAGGPVGVLLGKGDGSFAQEVTYSSGDVYAYSVVVGDFDTDGNDDLAVANFLDQGVGVLLGKGNGQFDLAVTYASGGSNTTSIASGDFNKDGHRDLAVANWGNGTTGVLLGKGDGSFALAATYTSSTGFTYAVASGDFNNDGQDDLATADYDSNDSGFMGVLLGNGNGSFQPEVVYPSSGRRPYSITTGDFNSDGKLDVSVSNTNNGYEGTVGVLLNTCGAVLKTYYRDKDGDGFGDPKHSILAAAPPPGYVSNKRDCDDMKVTYEDRDKDGFGSNKKVPCGGVTNHSDCNDDLVLYQDKDGDGYGSEVKVPCRGVTNNYDSNDEDGKPKIYICHKGRTLVINAHALKGHLRHGDKAGRCLSDEVIKNGGSDMVMEPDDQPLTLSAAPNPAVHTTRIQYTLPVDASVSLNVYDGLGREVTTLFNGKRSAGVYSQEYNTSKLASGLYYCRLTAAANGKAMVQTVKLVKVE